MANFKKLPSTFPNMVIVLTVVALVSALALSFTHLGTKKARELVEVKRTLKALKEVLPEFDNDPSSERHSAADFAELEIYPARKGGQRVGTAVKTYSDKGFTERIWLMVGFDIENKIYKIAVLKQRETPGLGTRMKESRFRKQFHGKNPAAFKIKVKKDGGEVDAITAATISSRAFCDAVTRAYQALLKAQNPKNLPPAANFFLIPYKSLPEKQTYKLSSGRRVGLPLSGLRSRFWKAQNRWRRSQNSAEFWVKRRGCRLQPARLFAANGWVMKKVGQKFLLSRFAAKEDTHRGQFPERGGEE